MQEKKEKWWQRYRSELKAWGAAAAYTLVIWQIASFNYRAEISSLKEALSEVTTAYGVLSKKAEGLFEARLIKIDTIRSARQHFTAFGGLVTFRWVEGGDMPLVWSGRFGPQRVRFKYLNFNSGETLPPEGSILHFLEVKSAERFDFTFDDRRYYCRFTIPFPDSQIIVGELYELLPFYEPEPEK